MDWKDYVGYQEISLDTTEDNLNVFYLQFKSSGFSDMSRLCLEITKILLDISDFRYDEDELKDAIVEILCDFPYFTMDKFEGNDRYKWKFGFGNYCKFTKTGELIRVNRLKVLPYITKVDLLGQFYHFQKNKLKNKIALNTRRGQGNTTYITNIKDYGFNVYAEHIFYKGNTAYDCPIMVIRYGEKYAIFKHPKFESYGFIMDFG
jgi:hypothetical protein